MMKEKIGEKRGEAQRLCVLWVAGFGLEFGSGGVVHASLVSPLLLSCLSHAGSCVP